MPLLLSENAEETAALATDFILREMALAIQERGRFTIALAGGSTPEAVYKLLAAAPRAAQGDWGSTHIFFGDERLVPPDDSRSNYAMAARTLLAGAAPISAEQVYPIPTVGITGEEAARQYAATLSDFFATPLDGPPPVFDLILLGLGDDGHTASLFPGMPSLKVEDTWTVTSPPGVLPPPVDRVSLTFPVLNAARSVLFLVTGEKKAEVLRKILEEKPDLSEAPAAGVRPTAAKPIWMADAAAARLLNISRAL